MPFRPIVIQLNIGEERRSRDRDSGYRRAHALVPRLRGNRLALVFGDNSGQQIAVLGGMTYRLCWRFH